MTADQRDRALQEVLPGGRTPMSRGPVTPGGKRRSTEMLPSRRLPRHRARIVSAALVTANTTLAVLSAPSCQALSEASTKLCCAE